MDKTLRPDELKRLIRAIVSLAVNDNPAEVDDIMQRVRGSQRYASQLRPECARLLPKRFQNLDPMASTDECPAPEELALLDEEPASKNTELLRRHVDECARCSLAYVELVALSAVEAHRFVSVTGARATEPPREPVSALPSLAEGPITVVAGATRGLRLEVGEALERLLGRLRDWVTPLLDFELRGGSPVAGFALAGAALRSARLGSSAVEHEVCMEGREGMVLELRAGASLLRVRDVSTEVEPKDLVLTVAGNLLRPSATSLSERWTEFRLPTELASSSYGHRVWLFRSDLLARAFVHGLLSREISTEDRRLAAHLLGTLRIMTAREALQQVAEDDHDPAVQEEARWALARLDA